jgi:putative endonuclease
MKLFHNYFVYILECIDQSYYTGVTNNIERRFWEHETGVDIECYTYTRRPLKLRYCERFQNVERAIAWEKQLKGWSRKKKEALFVDNWEEIKRLAKSYRPSPACLPVGRLRVTGVVLICWA